MKIVIGSDHAGFILKGKLINFLKKRKIQVTDAGTYSQERCDYPDIAAIVARKVSRGIFKRGILICFSGIGNSIVANRFSGVRAALCYNTKAAALTRQHNDSNILVLGAGFTNVSQAKKILNIWLKEEFQGARHLRRLKKIKEIEQSLKKNNL